MTSVLEAADVAEWVDRIRAEYDEMPGLSLTRDQMVRLFGLDPATCDVVLDLLTRARVLRKTSFGTYVGFQSAF